MSHRLGLVVGKFAPLHRGHELLIETALANCESVLLLCYCMPEPRGCPANLRRSWLERRFPSARVLVLEPGAEPGTPPFPPDAAPEELHRRFVGELCRDILDVRIDAVFSSESYGPPFAAALTTCYRERFVDYPAVVHVAVDPARRRIPISASTIRADVHASRQFLSPAVYASFVERVAILGGESSGKSTLARALAERFRTSWVAEYGRALWEEKHGELEFDDLLRIARRQIELEQSAAESAVRYLFCDTTPLVTRFYSNALFGRVDPALDTLCERPYSLFVLCAPDIPFDQDGTRRDEAFRLEQHEHYLQALRARNLPYLLVRGSVDERIAQVIRRLEARPSAQGLRRG